MRKSLDIVLAMVEAPLPFGNAAARWFYVLYKGLVARGHRVRAFAACGREADLDDARRWFPPSEYDLRLYAHRTTQALSDKWESLRRPYSYFFSDAFRRDLKTALADGFDVLHLEQVWSGWLGREVAERALMHVHYLASVDLDGAPSGSTGEWMRRQLIFRAEHRLLRHYPTISTLSPRLTECVRAIAPEAEVHTVPLGLDASLYPFEPAAGSSERPPVVGLIGSFGWYPTQSAGERLLSRLWPEIKRRVPEARLQIVGRQARTALAHRAHGPDIELVENVPDIIPYFRGTDVMLYAPNQGSGMKVKVLEAFALGVPVVTTAEGIEGLPVEDGRHAGVCEDDAGLIERTVSLLTHPEQRVVQARAARRLLEAHCGPESTVSAIEAIHEWIVAKTCAATAAPAARS